MKIAIAIPTYNRVEKLKVALDTIQKQQFPDDIELHIVISNIASTDSTSEFLDELQYSEKNIHIYNEAQDQWERRNTYYLAKAIPQGIDWVWLLGDDDYLSRVDSVAILANVIREHGSDDLTFLHACQSIRSENTGKLVINSLFNLCNTFGYHEMLGWFSSIVLRRDEFESAISESALNAGNFSQDNAVDGYLSSAYPHSAAIMRHCANKKAIFIDVGLAAAQDEQMTQDSVNRWASENMGERYLFVVDDLLRLKSDGVIEQRCSKIFFRYLTYSFWDRYSSFLLSQLINETDRKRLLSSKKEQEHYFNNWNRVYKISELLSEGTERKQVAVLAQLGTSLAKLALNDGYDEGVVNGQHMSSLLHHVNLPTYPFKIFNA